MREIYISFPRPFPLADQLTTHTGPFWLGAHNTFEIMDNSMEYLDLYHPPYAGADMQPSFHSQPQQPHGQPYGLPQHFSNFWNPHAMAYFQQQQQQQQQRAAMMGHAGMHGSKQTEPKPRLAKDEVELLEREFSKNQKPNSSTKRELAEQMGVEVPRINVGAQSICQETWHADMW